MGGNRRFGWHSGQIHCLNIQSGTADVTTDGSGHGTKSVTFNNTMKNTPTITLTGQEVDTSGIYSVTSSSVSGFDMKVQGSSVTNDTLTVGWIAVDQTD